MKKLSTLIIISLFFITNSFATHVAGGKINYKYIGNDKYKLTAIIIRDCNSRQLSNSPILYSCSAGNGSVTLPLISKRDVTGINPKCPIQSRCSGSFKYGLEELVYKGVLDLSALNCCEVTLSWSQASRVASNILVYKYSNFYIETTIDKCKGISMEWENISPQFFLNIGQDQQLNYSLKSDTAIDSVSYKLVKPLSAQGAVIPYSGQFSENRPLTFLGFPNTSLVKPAGFRVNSNNGNIEFRPTIANEVSVLCMEATAWKKINDTMRVVGHSLNDNIVYTLKQNYSSVPRQLASDTFKACIGDTSIALIDITDNKKGRKYELTLQHNLKWAEAKYVEGTKSKFVAIYFLADSLPPKHQQNAFTLTIKGDGCDVPGKSVRSYGIETGSGMFSDSSQISINKKCSVVSFDIGKKNTSPDIKYFWAVETSTEVYYQNNTTLDIGVRKEGWIKATLFVISEKHCNFFSYTDSVYISTADLVLVDAFGTDTVCDSKPVQVSATPTYGTAPFTYKWTTGQTGSAVSITPSKGDKLYFVEMTDSKGCKALDTVNIINYHPSINLTGDSLTCKGGKVNLLADIKDTTAAPSYSWNGLPQHQTQLRDSITAAKTYTFTINDGICTTTKSIEVKISEPFATFTHVPSTCSGTPIQITAIPQGGRAPYQVFWGSYQKSGNPISVSTNNVKTGTSHYFATVTDALGCKLTKVGSFEILATPKVVISPPTPVCETNSNYPLSVLVTPKGGVWGGNGVKDSTFNAVLANTGIKLLKYTFTNTNGCTDSSTTFIKVYAKPIIDFIADSTTIFKGSTISFTNATIADTTFISTWNFGDEGKQGNTFFGLNGSYTYNDTGKYTVQLKVDNGICLTDSILKTDYITVKEQPKNPNISIREINQNSLNLYPNPAKNKLTIETDNKLLEIVFVDVLGKRYTIENINPSTKAVVNIAHLAAGVYILEAKDIKGNIYTSKVQVSR